jgi:hypothetical protein
MAWVVRRPNLWIENGLPDTSQVLALVVAPAAVVMGTLLLRQLIRGRGLEPARIAWRFAAVVLLAFYLIAQERTLHRPTPESGAFLWDAHVTLVPYCGLLGLLGLALGLAPAPLRRAGRRRVGWPFSLTMTALAGTAGLGVLLVYDGAISSLVLIATEGVANALSPPPGPPRPGIGGRMFAALPAVLIAAVVCLVSASWLVREVRDGGSRPLRRSGALARLLSVLATAGAGLWLATVTLPALWPELADGLGWLIGPGDRVILAAGFGALAAGLAARATAPRPVIESPRLPMGVRLLRGAGWLVLALSCLWILALAVSTALARAFPETGGLGVPLVNDPSPFWSAWARLTSDLPRNAADVLGFVVGPERWPSLLLLGWLAAHLIALLFARDRSRPAVLDSALCDRSTAVRFLADWAAFAVLLATAMTTLMMAGLLASYFRVAWAI